MREISIDGTLIDENSDCYIIAEIGHNHQGNLETAKEIIAKAKELGVNAVKLQKRDNKALFTKAFYNSPYYSENSYGDTYGKHREFLEFGRDEYHELKKYYESLAAEEHGHFLLLNDYRELLV